MNATYAEMATACARSIKPYCQCATCMALATAAEHFRELQRQETAQIVQHRKEQT